MKKTMDGDILETLLTERYGVSLDSEETNYWNGQYYYWNEFKDYKGLIDLLG